MAAASTHTYIARSHVFLREKPEDLATVVSDGIYGEKVVVLEQRGKWSHIATCHDSYQGWVQSHRIAQHPSSFFGGRKTTKITRLRAHIYSATDTERGPVLSLGFGTRVKVLENSDPRWVKIQLVAKLKKTGSDVGYVQVGDTCLREKLKFESIAEFAKLFIGVPYAWGGRSSLAGFDCSGFTQMLYANMGIFLPRDSKDQFAWNQLKNVELGQLRVGDLIFWGGSPTEIRHVGMYMGDRQFIHSTVAESKPYVHISSLDGPDWNGSYERRSFVAGRRYAPPNKTV